MRLDPIIKEKLKKSFTESSLEKRNTVKIISAHLLSSEEIRQIQLQFPQYASHKVENVVDSSLLGGFVIQSGSESINLSIRSALQLLKNKLYESN